jgi:ribonuclease E
MTRKRIGAGLLEAFSETCDHCKGRGVLIHTEPVPEKRSSGVVSQVKAVAAAARTEAPPPVQQAAPAQSSRSRRRRGAAADTAPAEPSAETAIEAVDEPLEPESPAAVTAGIPPAVGSGIVARTAPNQPLAADTDDEYDITGYDLSRYDNGNGNGSHVEDDTEPLKLTSTDDPDAADDEDEEDEVVGAGAGRRRSRRGGTRRRTRP